MRTIIRALAAAYITYLAIAILVIMPLLNFLPPWYMQKTFDRQLHTEMVLLNPFTLKLEVREAQLPEHGGERFATLGKASVNLSLASLWRQGWVFDAVEVHRLYVHVKRLSDDEFNFSDMLLSDTNETPAEESDGSLPDITIHNFDFNSETIVLTDESREKPYSSSWNDLSISVVDLSTVIEEGRPYRIDVHGPAGGSLHWEGEVSVPNARGSGHLKLATLDLTALWRFAEPWVQFELKGARFSAEADYQLDWSDTFSYRVNDGQVSLSAVDIVPKSTVQLDDTAIGMQELSIADITVDSETQHATVAAITVDGLAVVGWSEGSRVSLAELFTVELPENSAVPEEPAAAEPEANTDSGWTAEIATSRIQASSLSWRTEYTDPPLLEINPVTASIDNITWPLSGDSPLTLNLTINEQAKVVIDGVLALANGDGSINYQLDGLPLTWFNPNLPAALNARLTSGEVQVDGQVALAGYAPTTLALGGAITDFSGKLAHEKASLTSWDTVRWEELLVDIEQHSVSMKKLSIDNYTGRIHINKDGSVNAQNVWREEVGEQAEAIASDLSKDKPWSVDIPGIQVTDSKIDFMDESLPIVFRTVIGDLNGTVLDISTDPAKKATVNIKGAVDGYAPVELKGNAQPLSTPPAIDLNLTFNGVDLALLTPYSSTYAGYAIDRGLLNLDLKYALQDNRLEGHNSVIINQLKLGEKVDSEDAVDLPLELALALLTDSNGVIDMQVPVSGNVDDPKFDVGSVIAKAIVNIITKAITAPFTLLANLVGSEDDLQHLPFDSGSAKLKDVNKARLDQLTTALAQRPALTLVITGRLNPQADREYLQQETLNKQLLESGLSQEALDSKGPAWEKAIMARYKAIAASSGNSAEVTANGKYDQVLQSIVVTDMQMKELAEARAVAVKSYLVNESGLSADRAVVEQAAMDDDAQSFSGVELGMGG